MHLVFDIGWALSRFMGSVAMGAKVQGRGYLPKDGAFILAPNHISYFDPPLVGSFVPRRLHFFAKQELFKVPILGAIIKRTNVHPVKRGVFDRGAITTAVKILQAGNPLTVFPEGTRGSCGKFLPPKPGIGMIARKAEVSIIPCYIEGSEALWPCILRKKRVRICYGPAIGADWIRSLPESKESWLKIADEVMSRLVGLRAAASDGVDCGSAPAESNEDVSAIDSAGVTEDSGERVDTRSMTSSVTSSVA
jgi:1-acyl-sn-glycerol-3-phosphate acyltransferase